MNISREEGVIYATVKFIGRNSQRKEMYVHCPGQIQLHNVQNQFQGRYVQLVFHHLCRLVAITEAIKIRNSQIYMNEMEQKLHKAIKGRINGYVNKCINIKDQSKVIALDDIGRKALKIYFKKNKV